MLIDFFLHLKQRGLPVSLTEFLTLLEALEARVITANSDDFYLLARTVLVKDEARYDLFDAAFGEYFRGIAALPDPSAALARTLPEEWLKLLAQRVLSAEERAQLEKLGWDELFKRLKERLDEQKERHAGGSKWIGTGGSSPFGHGGYHPEGIRIGGPSAGNRTAVKVWEKREFRNLADDVELGTRNIKVALRRLRRFARQGAATELDLDATIEGTARNAGTLDLHLRPERHNAVKVLLCLDVGGSMDDHIRVCEELFSAARSEFKHLEHYYFHNCVYESLWRDNRRRHDERIATWQVLHTYPSDYRLIFVGDATMSPYEIVQPGGSVEHWNEEPGAAWLKRMLAAFPHAVWLNPVPEAHWPHSHSLRMVRELMGERMYPLTLDGLARAIHALGKGR
ncbi:VWA containing CoxE family protein [Oryzomicrobium terrae]|uniref:VWA containing CoxE family protein n=1 Tax=Oryzomicrobium terrae TaxID=1735038 RepID=A0A5C1E974_9RHOO|nr:VWA domain-containing protein [Oryzomicrobium terrae]QEL65433.1 VWA containing CoxE family protein [Oryzomicrobium terrae]